VNKVAFTIVLNGELFIERLYRIIEKNFDHWYVVEGVAKNINCTKWCKEVSSDYHKNFLSIDYTTRFLDSISRKNNVTVIRKKNKPWNGKLEMCNSFMPQISNTLLMQIDVDEYWDDHTLSKIFEYCSQNNFFNAMQFRCNYYLGKNLIVDAKNCYGDMIWDWWRLWLIRNPTLFKSHEPPSLLHQPVQISKEFTDKQGWRFDHFAYIHPSQVKFKEHFYGYKNALNSWNTLNSLNDYTNISAHNYLPWINTTCPLKKI